MHAPWSPSALALPCLAIPLTGYKKCLQAPHQGECKRRIAALDNLVGGGVPPKKEKIGLLRPRGAAGKSSVGSAELSPSKAASPVHRSGVQIQIELVTVEDAYEGLLYQSCVTSPAEIH